MRHWIATCLILLFAIALRLFDLASLPNGLHWDEMDTGYQAFSLLSTGKDYFGRSLPVFVHSLADYRTPILIYSAVPVVKLYGLSAFSVRLVSAMWSAISLLTLYILARRLTSSANMGLLSLLFASISPWHFQYSRQSVETMSMLALLTLALAAFFSKKPALAGLFFGLTMLAYSPAKLFVPLLVVFLVFKYRPKVSWLSVVLFLIPAIFILFDGLTGSSGLRFKQLSILNDPTTQASINYQREQMALSSGRPREVGMSPSLLDQITYNKPQRWLSTFTTNYLSAFSTDFLFIHGDTQLRHSPSSSSLGQLNFFEFIPLAVGLLSIVTQPLLAFWFMVGPIPASLTTEGNPHAARLSLWLPVLIMLVSLGINRLHKKSPLLSIPVFLLVFYSSLINFAYFFTNYRWESAAPFQYGFSQLVTWAARQTNPVYLDMGEHSGLMAFLFATAYPPSLFQSQVVRPNFQHELLPGKYGYTFGNVNLFMPGRRDWLEYNPDQTTILAVSATQYKSDELSRFGQIDYPDSTPAFYLTQLVHDPTK
jgi:4-amino-4-deoxy-L-arabinose transferase-like glycosyltransferase